MALPKEKITLTIEEYLASERASVERHEYLDGLVYAMAGESPTHGTICTNLISEVRVQLKGTPCQAWSKDCKVRSGPVLDPRDRKGLFSYPDLVVFCGEPSFHDAHRDVLTNPVVIIEVLSPSTEVFDRGEKFARLRTWNPSLLDYLLVSQSSPFVEQFTRREDGSWLYRFGEDLSASLSIESIGCTLHLAEVYDRIVFPLPTLPEEVVTLEGDTT